MMGVLSYDIFDTCLTRVCGVGTNVFYAMAVNGIGMAPGSRNAFDFVNYRMRAEEDARSQARKIGKAEVMLQDIYEAIKWIPENWTAEALMQLELSMEDTMLRPVKGFAEEVARQRAEGKRILYITDMYLPESFIRGQLQKHGFWAQGDKLYVSHVHNAIKFDGSLFDVVLKNEGISSGEMRHMGDHEQGDLAAPRAKGIRAELVGHGYNKFEQSWLTGAEYTPHSKDVELMAALSRSFRLKGECSVEDTLISSVIAPMFVPFVGNVLEDAKRRGISRLYFQARDGKVLFQIARELVKDYPGMEVRYLYGSRRSFYLPGLVEKDKGMIAWFLHGSEGRTPIEMLMRLNLCEDFFIPHLERLGVEAGFLHEPMDSVKASKLEEIMLDDVTFDALYREAAVQREIVREYLAQEGLMEPGKFGVVDIGWSRLSHQCLSNIVGGGRVFGYFLAVFRQRYNGHDAAEYYAAIYPEALPVRSFDHLFSSAMIAFLEQFMAMTDEASCIGYERADGKVRPKFGRKSQNVEQYTAFMQRRDKALEEFTREYRMLRPMLRYEEMLAAACGLRSIMVLFNDPEDEEISLLLPFRPDNSVDDTLTFIKKLSVRDIVNELFRRAKGQRVQPPYLWREASIKYSFGNAGMSLFRYVKNQKKDRKS